MEVGPMIEMCHVMGDPQLSVPAVHIGGTNGKGSTAAFLAHILRENDYRVGLFTSPHLTDIRERIRINGRMIGKKDMLEISTRIMEFLPEQNYLSFFEFVALAAFLAFRDKNVDIAVIETGLGGRLDATNVIEPKVTILTPISVDHQRHLGATVKEISIEKCGIIKRGVPTVTAVQPEEAMQEIRRFCDDVGSPLFVAHPDKVNSELGLVGEHQRQNAACAVEAAQLLADAGWRVDRIPKALSDTRWAGRIEILREEPTVLIDGAHNLAGAESLAHYVRTTYPRDHAVLMLGILEGKDISGICRTLVPHFREVICVRAPSHRAASPKDLAAMARSFGATVHMAEGVTEALEEWLGKLSVDDTLVVSGSLSTIGVVRNMFKENE